MNSSPFKSDDRPPLGPEQLAELLDKLRRGSHTEKHFALKKIADEAGPTADVLAALRAAADDPDEWVSRSAVRVHHKFVPDDDFAYERVLTALRSTDDADMLSDYLEDAEAVSWERPGLFLNEYPRLLHHPDEEIRCATITVIRTLLWEPHVEKSAFLLADLLPGTKSPSAEMRKETALALGAINAPVDDVLPELLSLCLDPEMDVRESAYHAIGRIGPPARQAIPLLVSRLRVELESGTGLQIFVAWAIEAVGLDDDSHHPELWHAISNGYENIIDPLTEAAKAIRPFRDEDKHLQAPGGTPAE